MSPTSIAEEEIFQAARRIGSAEARRAYLDQVCRDNESLREQVELLLAAFDSSDNFLESPSSEIAAEIPARDQTISEGLGTVIGPYRLVQQIGEGGMGIVFLAEQERPVKRRVALKVIKPGMDTRQVIARFEAERQALAMMDHPNIAKVLDAGTTGAGSKEQGAGSPEEFLLQAPSSPLPASSGRPYFVMELVHGVPITEYCDECNLTTQERLKLFIVVCQAVQHAHQKGIIHRDLKPNNVLVAIQDSRPEPKIIDFGVAKAVDQRLTEHTLTTAFAQMVGTPLYMSPEQAELSPLGVDTRSDIYSLGVMLYELLTGATPFDRERLRAVSFDELRRIIREEDPLRPSARVSTLAADLSTTVAEKHRSDPRRLSQSLRGELDWIVMKCLDKDRNRRYENASSLADDVKNYLHDRPVSAVAPSRFYRARKLVRRNKWPVLASGAVLAGLVATIIAMAIGLASQRRLRAEAQLNFAASLHSRGKFAEAETLYREGIDSAGIAAADDRQRAARTRLRLARVVYDQGKSSEADRLYREAIAAYRAEFPPGDANIAHAQVTFALLLRTQQRFEEAESLFREAYETYRRAMPANHRAVGETATHLANVLITLGRNENAVLHAKEAITQLQLAVPYDEMALAFARLELGRALLALSKFPEAEQQLLEAEQGLIKTDAFHLGILAPIALYTTWDLAQPGNGYDAKAQERISKLINTFVRVDARPSVARQVSKQTEN